MAFIMFQIGSFFPYLYLQFQLFTVPSVFTQRIFSKAESFLITYFLHDTQLLDLSLHSPAMYPP